MTEVITWLVLGFVAGAVAADVHSRAAAVMAAGGVAAAVVLAILIGGA